MAAFLNRHPGWAADSAAPFVPAPFVTPDGAYAALPHEHGTDGAFAVRLRAPGAA